MKRVSRLPRRFSCKPETLESRRLLSISVQPISNLTLPQGSAAQTYDLTQVFTDTTTEQADLTFAAKSDNTSLVQAILSTSTLTLAFAPTGSGFAHISITATAPDGSTAADTLRIQVTAAADRTLTVPLGTAGHTTFRYVEANNTIGQITLTGPGSGTITMGGDHLSLVGDQARGANQEVESIDLTGTTAATNLVINGVEADKGTVLADVGNITSTGSLNSLRIKKVILDGDVSLSGGISSINLDAAQSSTLAFAKSDGVVQVTAGSFGDVNFSTPAPVGLVRVTNWLSTDSIPESFQAASISRIYSIGNFDVGVQLTGAGTHGRTLGKITVAGVIGGTWNIPGSSAPLLIGGTTPDWDATFANLPYITDVGNFSGSLTVPRLTYLRVHGIMEGALLDLTGTGGVDLHSLLVYDVIAGSEINSSANVGSIQAEALENSLVYAGVGTSGIGQELPTAASELNSDSAISSIALRPRGKVTVSFSDSDIAAGALGNLGLGTTKVDNSGTAYGVAAQSIGRLTVRDLVHHRQLALSKINDETTLAARIAASGFSLEDLSISVLS